MNLKLILGLILVSIFFVLGIIFAFASVFAPSRLVVAGLFFVVGFGIIFYVARKPKSIIHRVEFSGQMKAVVLKCPNCSASIDSDNIKIVSGVPYATCDYCGHVFEVIEEPKW
jgi:hypothetical protein